jgi:hypothetical protein
MNGMKRPTRPQACMGAAAVLVLGLFGGWWYSHDPFRSIDRYATYDSTAYYQPARNLFETPRCQRTMFFKGLTVDRVYKLVKDMYPAKDGWEWSTDSLPDSFAAHRANKADRLPETISASITSEGTVELTEFRVVPKSEQQVVLRTRGSDAFVPYPLVRRPRPPRLREEDDNSFSSRFLNAG